MNSNLEILIRNHLLTTFRVCKNNDEFIQHTAIPNKLFLENQKEGIDYIRNYFLRSLPNFNYTIKYRVKVQELEPALHKNSSVTFTSILSIFKSKHLQTVGQVPPGNAELDVFHQQSPGTSSQMCCHSQHYHGTFSLCSSYSNTGSQKDGTTAGQWFSQHTQKLSEGQVDGQYPSSLHVSKLSHKGESSCCCVCHICVSPAAKGALRMTRLCHKTKSRKV